jgi:triosephosphate isomerase
MSGWRSKFLIGSNHKMYKTAAQTVAYLKALQASIRDLDLEHLHLFILPPFTAIPDAVRAMKDDCIHIGAQNMCWEETGQFTGEVSPLFLEELGVRLVMIGHSERRHTFGETDWVINKKVVTGLRHGFTVLLCVGETAQEKGFGIGRERIREQVKIALAELLPAQLDRLWIAYEPVWAIGVGSTPATPEYAASMHQVIRDVLLELFPESGSQVPILYGGSINPDNAPALLQQPLIDGLFIGRSAWDAEGFDKLIRSVYPIWQQKNL